MEEVLRHSHFQSDPWGDGGSKRTAQISEILEEAGIGQEFYQPDITRIFQKKFAALEGLRLLRQHRIQSGLTKNALTQLGFNYYKRQKTMAYYAGRHRVLLWESSRQQNYLMSYAARDSGLKIIGLPHNLESLVSGQHSEFTGKPAPYWFEEELQSLRQCHALFTISREEQYILKLFGIPAEFLPYYPPAPVVRYLQKIRERREKEPAGSDILLMGTAGNKPTFDGMLNRILFFHNHPGRENRRLHIAGYLTETLAAYLPENPSLIFHGSVSQEKLADLMAVCSFCWIHQNISTGSLTKIPELMMAGVPVVLNADAARNFHNVPGIRVYEHDEDCKEALQEIIPVPPVPEKPRIHERIFLDTIRNLMEKKV